MTDPTWFRSGATLHAHTLHSREPLSFFYRIAAKLAPVRFLLRRGLWGGRPPGMARFLTGLMRVV